jgi:hypothetical protein
MDNNYQKYLFSNQESSHDAYMKPYSFGGNLTGTSQGFPLINI